MQMIISKEQFDQGGNNSIILEHKGEQLEWNAKSYSKTFKKLMFSVPQQIDISKHINGYWASQRIEQQDQIFRLFKAIKSYLSTFTNVDRLLIELRPIVAQLMQFHEIADTEHWLIMHAGTIHIPHLINESMDTSTESTYRREKTYLKSDYYKLIALALSLRAMLPIWAEFIELTTTEINPNLKEYFAYLMLGQTNIEYSEPMQFLRVYLKTTLEDMRKNKEDFSQIIDGLGTENFDNWVLSLVLIKRVCVGDIEGNTPGLVSGCFGYLRNYLGGAGNGGRTQFNKRDIRQKAEPVGDSDDKDISLIENYKIKQRLSIGAIAPFEMYLEQPHRVAERAYAQIDHALLDEFLASVMQRAAARLWPPQMTLAKIMLARVVSPRALDYVDKQPYALNAIAIAQTVLWQKGYLKLAGLISAQASHNEETSMVGSGDQKVHIDKPMQAELDALFPFRRKSMKREKTTPPNDANVAIDKIVDDFRMRDWILMLPDRFVQQLVGNASRRYPCPSDLKLQLARLTIDIAKRQ